jgi:hypothetical protein
VAEVVLESFLASEEAGGTWRIEERQDTDVSRFDSGFEA